MPCMLRQRKDDIPKRSAREKTWSCERCGAIMFAERKPHCRLAMLSAVQAKHAAAEAEAITLDLDHKVKPTGDQ